jgi:hypothetical protein
MKLLNFTPNTRIKIKYKDSTYVPGQGSTEEYKTIAFYYGGQKSEYFYCEWKGAFGSDVLEAESNKIKELGTVRMGYNPDVWSALTSKEVKIYRNNEEMPFTAVGAPDNFEMLNIMLEFKVKRLDVK